MGVVHIGGSEGTPDLVVEADDRVNWAAFDPFTVPADYPWPRVVRYEGNDPGLFAWSEHRPIETFSWAPTKAVALVPPGCADADDDRSDVSGSAASRAVVGDDRMRSR